MQKPSINNDYAPRQKYVIVIYVMINTLQQNIKRQLQAKNMTAAGLERRTGIPHAVINILHGRSKNPSIKTAQAIAKELGCTVEELIAEEGAAQTPITTWRPEIYTAALVALNAGIAQMNLQPKPEMVGKWLTEIYNYTIGSPRTEVDQRFVLWLLSR